MATKPSFLLTDVIVSLGAAVSSFTEKSALKKLIDSNGGRVSYMINSETTHFIADEEEVQAKSLKVRTAMRYGCYIVSKEWLVRSCESGERQNELNFALYKDAKMVALQSPLTTVRSSLVRALMIIQTITRGIADGTLKNKDDSIFGLREPGMGASINVVPSSSSVTDQHPETSGEGGVKGEDPAWVEVMSKKAHAMKQKRLREQEERKVLREQEAKAQKQEEHNELRMTQLDRAEYYRKLRETRNKERRAARLAQLEEGWKREKARQAERLHQRLMEKEKKKQAWLDMVNEKKKRKEEWLQKRKEWEDGLKERERKKKEFVENKKKWDAQKEREMGRKIFVGGFKFNDLTEAALGSATLVEFTAQKRRERIKQIFPRFGEVEEIREHWAKDFIFVLYKLPADALNAKRTLTQFPERAKIVESIRAEVLKKGESLLLVPKTSFYVRWPKKETPKEEEEQKKEEEEEIVDDGGGEWEDGTGRKGQKKKAKEALKKQEQEKKAKAEGEAKDKSKGKKKKEQDEGQKKKKPKKAKSDTQEGKGKGKRREKGKGKEKEEAGEKKVRNPRSNRDAAGGRGTGRGRGRGRGGRGGSRGGRGGAKRSTPDGSASATPRALTFGHQRGRGGSMARGGGRGRGGRGGRGRAAPSSD